MIHPQKEYISNGVFDKKLITCFQISWCRFVAASWFFLSSMLFYWSTQVRWCFSMTLLHLLWILNMNWNLKMLMSIWSYLLENSKWRLILLTVMESKFSDLLSSFIQPLFRTTFCYEASWSNPDAIGTCPSGYCMFRVQSISVAKVYLTSDDYDKKRFINCD